jgi:hypothetical protein
MAPKRQAGIALLSGANSVAALLTRSLCLHFNNRVRLGRALGEPFTYQIEELKAGSRNLIWGARYDAVTNTMSHLKEAKYSRRILLALTDGGDSSSIATPADVRTAASKGGRRS